MSWLARILLEGVGTEIERVIVHYGAELLGLDPEEVNDPKSKCPAVLDVGLTPEVCRDFRAVRRWVMCRAWQLLDSGEAKRFRDAIRRAWREEEEACGVYA